MSNPATLICPKTNQYLYLTEDDCYYQTEDKLIRYPVEQGIIRFLKKKDDFYEGAYLATVKWLPKSEKWYHAWPLWGITNRYLWKVRKYIPKGSSVLELGCGGGVKYFSSRYKMIGLDLSFKSLQNVPSDYEYKIQADALNLPLSNDSVDAIISSCFWEHIEPALKHKMLNEFYRILKKSGKILFYYDIDTVHPYISAFKTKHPAEYKKQFIDKDGHLGYQTVQENESIFTANNFRVIKHFGVEKTLFLQVSVFTKMQYLSGLTGFYAKMLKKLLSFKLINLPYLYLTVLVDATIGRLLPMNYSRIIMSLCEKK